MTHTTHLSQPVNLRDLGGHRSPDGRLRHGLVVRSDDLSVITPDCADDLTLAGLSHVIDLRSQEEAAHTGRGPLAARAVAYHHLPLTAGPTPPPPPGPREPEEMARDYERIFTYAAGEIATALEVIAAARGMVAFHCSAGKDRTGILAAVLLSSLSVGSRDVVADYARTEGAMPGVDRGHAPGRAGRFHPAASAREDAGLTDGAQPPGENPARLSLNGAAAGNNGGREHTGCPPAPTEPGHPGPGKVRPDADHP
jgi:protein-tyrosine phosphatase